MSTFATLRTRCAVRFSDSANALITDTVWKDYVNAAYRRVHNDEPLWPWRELESLVLASTAETRAIALPTDVTRVLSVHDHTNYVKLEPLDGVAEDKRLWVTQTEDGIPVCYRVRNVSLLLYPLPLDVYTYYVEYLGRAADLSGDSDLPVFPSQYHDILVEGALADAYADDGNMDQFKLHDERYKELLQGMRLDLLAERTERYYEITDNFY